MAEETAKYPRVDNTSPEPGRRRGPSPPVGACSHVEPTRTGAGVARAAAVRPSDRADRRRRRSDRRGVRHRRWGRGRPGCPATVRRGARRAGADDGRGMVGSAHPGVPGPATARRRRSAGRRGATVVGHPLRPRGDVDPRGADPDRDQGVRGPPRGIRRRGDRRAGALVAPPEDDRRPVGPGTGSTGRSVHFHGSRWSLACLAGRPVAVVRGDRTRSVRPPRPANECGRRATQPTDLRGRTVPDRV